MNGTESIRRALQLFSIEKARPLAPQWDAELAGDEIGESDEALGRVSAALGWPAPREMAGRPRPDQFPLLVHDPASGWAVARQWDSEDAIRLAGPGGQTLPWHEGLSFYEASLPDPLGDDDSGRALPVFWRAIMRRKQPLVMAGLATVFANILALATSLYSMQLYDRVIPLASYNTLFVLTVGVLFALLLDFTLRALRATLVEREAVDIDAEVSEVFFARAQAIRLDARPPQIGTLAAQLRGQEQIRQVLSSSSLFLLADLPFALFFIFVIYAIGGPLALVPMVSLPLAVLMAFILARMIRKGADRAQVSGNRKNGMLVESLDAAESVKANRGTWLLLGRWNQLVREVGHYEIGIKRVSAVSQSLFQTLQQFAYVTIMGWGAWLVSQGELTVGALLACSIIAGRINGPLVAQLPNLIVQWGYARSSLKALDTIMQLPLDHAVSGRALRTDALGGALTARNVTFAYPGGRQALEVENLDIKPGERVAVVGGVGSGKTTLLKVLSGLYSPQGGSVLVGGMDAGQVAEENIRRHIGYLPQDARLVHGTLRDNLVMGIEDPGDEAIMETAKTTSLSNMIASHPQGLSMPITEGGRGLSGGQRSLVLLNRLLHARPKVWLLDEPTAALDQTTEKAILGAIGTALRDDDILVMVTHKPQLLEMFGRIVVMQDGQIVKDAPASEMLKAAKAQASGSAQADDSRGTKTGTVTVSAAKLRGEAG